MFDSNLLKQKIESMISSGKRNICVDVVQLDYLYSDAINALIVMNKRMLDVFGRLSLLSPQPPVLEILRKAGIHNILKIFLNDTELIRTSEEIGSPSQISPTVSVEQPQSEFDELRSEIGSAFEPRAAAAPVEQQQQEAAQRQERIAPQYTGFQAPPQPETERRPSFAVPPPPVGPASRYASPPLRSFEGAPPRTAPRAYPPTPPPKPASMTTGAETRRMPSFFESPQAGRPRYQPEPIAPQEEDLSKFEAILETKPSKPEKPASPRFDEEFDEIPKHRPLVPVLLGIVGLIVVGAIGFFAFNAMNDKKEKAAPPVAAVQEQKAPIDLAQQPAVTTPPAQSSVSATPPSSSAESTVASSPAAVKSEEPPPVAKKRTPPRAPVEPKPVVSRKSQIPKPKRQPLDEPEEEVASVASTPEPTPSSSIEVFDEPPPTRRTRPTPPPPAVEPEEEDVEEREPPKTRPSRRASVQAQRASTASEPTASISSGGGEEGTIFLSSVPPVADVYMDGKLIGKTNVMELKILSGTHTLRFVKGDKEFTKTMTFQPGKNPSMFIPLK